jgi:hypothetical protein
MGIPTCFLSCMGHQAAAFQAVLSNPRPNLYNLCIQSVQGGKVNILGGHSIGHSKQKTLYEHVSYSERFPR